jgi:integrase
MKRHHGSPRSGKPTFPVVVERGPAGLKATATILRSPVVSKGKTYESFVVKYYEAGKRRRKRFNTFAKALSSAEEIATELCNGRNHGLILRGAEQRCYQAALEALRKIGSPEFDSVAREFAAAKAKLDDTPLIEAVSFFITHGGRSLKKAPLEDIRAKMLADLESDKRSGYHISTVGHHTKRFVDYFKARSITSITTSDINTWLRDLPGGGRNRDNHRDSIQNFLNFARSEGYLPKSLPLATKDAARMNEESAENEIYTVKEGHALIEQAPKRLIPTLAIKLFAGLRSEEVFRLDWAAIKFDRDVIILSKAITKTNIRRLVPLLPNLKRWLLPYKDSTGKVAERWSSPKTMCRAWTGHARNAGVAYKKNGMRNSFISYRVAVVKSIAQVALESGNSPAVIDRDYRELATEADGKSWFAIVP